MESGASKKLALLQGHEGVWIKARRENFWYILNKLCSMGVGLLFAGITLSFKITTYEYYD